ncbi:MAG: SBBP repeat-containing protein [Nitrospinota bacterium]
MSVDDGSTNGGANGGTVSHTTVLLSILDGTEEYDSGQDVVTDSQNYIYVAGITKGDLGDDETNSGLDDAFLRKYEESGTLVWDTLLGTASEDQASNITLDGGGNVYMTGKTRGNLSEDSDEINAGNLDAFITKHSSDGNLQWTVLVGTTASDVGSDIAVDSSGNVIIVGSTDGGLGGGTNAGASDAFIAKYDSTGTNTWTKLLGSTGYDYAYAVATDSNDNIYVTGKTNSDLNDEVNSGDVDAFIAKYDSTGTLLWLKLLGTVGYEEGLDVTTDSDGNVYICGYTNGDLSGTNSGGTDAFMAKYTSSGTKKWTKLLGTSSAERATGIRVDSSDKIYLTGYTAGNLNDETNSGLTDAFVAQYDSTATLVSVTLLGTNNSEYSNAITLDISGNIYIVGRSDGAFSGLENTGDYDFFVVKM